VSLREPVASIVQQLTTLRVGVSGALDLLLHRDDEGKEATPSQLQLINDCVRRIKDKVTRRRAGEHASPQEGHTRGMQAWN
jgi:hypothetical protein